MKPITKKDLDFTNYRAYAGAQRIVLLTLNIALWVLLIVSLPITVPIGLAVCAWLGFLWLVFIFPDVFKQWLKAGKIR